MYRVRLQFCAQFMRLHEYWAVLPPLYMSMLKNRESGLLASKQVWKVPQNINCTLNYGFSQAWYAMSIPHLHARVLKIGRDFVTNTRINILRVRSNFFLKFGQISTLCSLLTHWGRVTHICVSKLTIIGSDNGLPPGRRHVIIRTNVGILLIGPLGTNFSEILIVIETFSFKKSIWKCRLENVGHFVSATMG